MKRLSSAATALLAMIVTACGSPDDGGGADGEVQVVAGFYPLQYLAERVGGDLVRVSNLAQPGAEPHDLELSPQQIQQVADADLVLYLAAFQPALDDAIAENAAETGVDLLREGDSDPHVWLDPVAFADLATVVGDRLSEVDPGNAATYSGNAEALGAELAALDEEFRTGLADCDRDEIVTTHDAFGHLADRYGLDQRAIAGLSPEDEPSPQRLDEVRQFAEENGVTTIFYEEAVGTDFADTIAGTVGADTAVLSPLEVVTAGEDYLSGMRANLATLRTALGCP